MKVTHIISRGQAARILALGLALIAAPLAAASGAQATVQVPATASQQAVSEISISDRAEAQKPDLWAQRAISARDAKAIAQRHVPGAKFVDVKKSGKAYRVRLIRKDGRVVDVFVDAATGRVRN